MGRTRIVTLLTAVLIVASFVDAGAARAATSYTSRVTRINAPASVAPGGTSSSDYIRAFPEAPRSTRFPEGIATTLEADLPVDTAARGRTYDAAADLLPASIPARRASDGRATTVRSYFLHAQRPGTTATNVTLTGSVKFDQPILGVIVTQDRLDATDRLLGAELTQYPTARPKRGPELSSTGDRFSISADGLTLTVRLRFASPGSSASASRYASPDQIRVLTGVDAQEECTWTGTADPDGTSTRPYQHGDGTANDVLCGLGGDDHLFGAAGNDILRGGSGTDRLIGDDLRLTIIGHDTLVGGDDVGDSLYPERGDDIVWGGRGFDAVYASDGGPAVCVDLRDGRTGIARDKPAGGCSQSGTSPWAGTDTLSNIEDVWGTNGADEIHGSDVTNDSFYGRGGNDILDGRGGNDRLHGDDTYYFDHPNRPNGNDTLYGGPGQDWFFGGLGTDTFYGDRNQASSTTYPDEDTAMFKACTSDDDPSTAGCTTYAGTRDPRAVEVDLRTTPGTATGHGEDTLHAIENIRGGWNDDTIHGSGLDNDLRGGEGDDLVYGYGGDDVLFGGCGTNVEPCAPTDPGIDEVYGGAGNDVLIDAPDAAPGDLLNGGSDRDVCQSPNAGGGRPGADEFVACEAIEHDVTAGAGLVGLTSGGVASPSATASATLIRWDFASSSEWKKVTKYYDYETRTLAGFDVYITEYRAKEIATWAARDQAGEADYGAGKICSRFNRTTSGMSSQAAAQCDPFTEKWWTGIAVPEFNDAKAAGRCVRIKWRVGMNRVVGYSDRAC